jgi:hypothetical protein
VARKNSEGIEALRPKIKSPSIEELTLLDFYVAYTITLAGKGDDQQVVKEAFDLAEAMLKERMIRL